MNYIIYDLEATCWDEDQPVNFETEIIEIGAVKLDSNFQERSFFQEFVRPIAFPVLSDFCKSLTSIKQKHVDNALIFSEVIMDFKRWIGSDSFVLCSWGSWDKEQLILESKKGDLDYTWISPHINLKDQYRDIKMLKRTIGFKQAFSKEGLLFEGTPHRGIDDARNLAKLFQIYCPLWNFKNLI